MPLLFNLAIAGLFIGMACAMEKPCCFSKKFFGKLKIVTVKMSNGSSDAQYSENRLEVDYDYDMKMERARGSIFIDDGNTQSSTNYSVTSDFKNMKRYTLSSNMDSCKVEMIKEEMNPHCVPSTLQWGATYTFGAGSEALQANSWEGMVDNLAISMQTTVNDCTPVAMTRAGMTPEGDRISESILYADFTQYQVSSADAFKVPDMCMTVGMTVG